MNFVDKKEYVEKTTLINRDLNGALNIRLKGICIIFNKPLPNYFTKSNEKIDNNKTNNKKINNKIEDKDKEEKTVIIIKGKKNKNNEVNKQKIRKVVKRN